MQGWRLQAEPQDSWRIGFIVFFCTVTAFGSIGVGLIGFIGTVTAFLILCSKNNGFAKDTSVFLRKSLTLLMAYQHVYGK